MIVIIFNQKFRGGCYDGRGGGVYAQISSKWGMGISPVVGAKKVNYGSAVI